MSKNILTESTKSKFKVLEHKPANVLKRIQGVLSDFKSNRNGRIYPRELWENVLNSDYVKEMIESHGLVGELDHPEERLEISLQNVSHVINDMWIEGDQVMGTIDILPTPSGKIVSELIDYGTDIGISSRGAGSVGAGNIVDSDYQFVTFDFVARPSCEAARLNTIVESVQTEIDNNSDDKVKSILEDYKDTLRDALGTTAEEVLLDKYGLNGDDEFKYMMLGRLQSDCKYVLGAAEGNMKHLWVRDDPHTHCEIMRELYNTVSEKPDWITLEDIDNYEEQMLNYNKNINESEETEWSIEIITNGELAYKNNMTADNIDKILDLAKSIKPLDKDFYGEAEKIDMDKEDKEFDEALDKLCKAINAKPIKESYRANGWYYQELEYSDGSTAVFMYHAIDKNCDFEKSDGKFVCSPGEYITIDELINILTLNESNKIENIKESIMNETIKEILEEYK